MFSATPLGPLTGNGVDKTRLLFIHAIVGDYRYGVVCCYFVDIFGLTKVGVAM